MIKLIKLKDVDDREVQFNPAHVTHIYPFEGDMSEVYMANGEKFRVKLRVDDLAARITR